MLNLIQLISNTFGIQSRPYIILLSSLTNYMEQVPFSEGNILVDSQEIPHLGAIAMFARLFTRVHSWGRWIQLAHSFSRYILVLFSQLPFPFPSDVSYSGFPTGMCVHIYSYACCMPNLCVLIWSTLLCCMKCTTLWSNISRTSHEGQINVITFVRNASSCTRWYVAWNVDVVKDFDFCLKHFSIAVIREDEALCCRGRGG